MSRRHPVAAANQPPPRRRWVRALFSAAAQAGRSSWTPVVMPLLTALGVSARHPYFNTRGRADRLLDRPLLIPERTHPFGPMTTARQRRMLAMLASVQVAGVAATASGASAPGRAFATGMMVPGAGLLAVRDPVRFAVSVGAFGFSLLLWFGAGSMAAPPLVWTCSAAWAARRAVRGARVSTAAPWLIAAAVVVAAAEQTRWRRRVFASQREQATAANTVLATAHPPLRGAARPDVYTGDELGDVELALTRRFVDMANQDVDDWSNWTVIDQFQPAALRYQIDAMINALALQRYVHAPAASAYLDDAQRRLIDRYQQKKVWGYWALENLWGNLEWDPDPAKKQNIMMTGYYALSIGLYQTVSGDYRHSERGAINFRWNARKNYPYSLGELCSALTADYVRSPWGLVVCEPNWIFALCNLRGATALRVHDRLHGTTFWDQIKDGFVSGFEDEIVRPDGAINAYRSSRSGVGQVGVASATDLRPLLPHIADRRYVLLRAACTPGGEVHTPLRDDDRLLDPGNYSFHPLTAYASVMEDAREAGDVDLFRGAYDELRSRANLRIDPRGWLQVDGASTLAYTLLGRALFGRHGGWIDLVEKGMPDQWRTGPRLSTVPFPDVMIARAALEQDTLVAVLRCFGHGGRYTVGLDRLDPGRRYTLRGAVASIVNADENGCASVEVDLRRRREIRVTPDV